MRRAVLFVAGAALFLLALVVTAPASLVDGRLNALSAGRLRMANASGTLWNGAGEVRVPPGNAGVPVSWHIDALPLLWGELRGTLAGSDDTAPAASFSLSAREVSLRNVGLALPAGALLRAAGAPVALATAGGNVGLRISELNRRGDRIEGQVALRWDQATLQAASIGARPSPRIALGDVRFDGTGQGNAIAGMLANADGDVDISGTVSIALDGTARVDALVSPRVGIDAERASAISGALALVGRPEGTGAFRIALVR
jgi:general secretion pathway protein N